MARVTFGNRIGPALQVEVLGNKDASRALTEAGERAEDMRPAMLQIKGLLIEGHTRQFATKGAYLGTPWAPNAPGTLARKHRAGIPSLSTPMVESGDLEQSLSGGKGSRSRIGKGSVRVGTTLFYAVFHIKGAKGKGRKSGADTAPRKGVVPPRPPVGINEAEERASLMIMERHVLARRG